MRYLMIALLASFVCFGSTMAMAAKAEQKTVAAVNKEKAALQGKQVTIKGKVVKVNNGIMRRNFVHIQDGTGGKDTNNLIVTTQDAANVGDEVIATGTVVLDTDFTMGYFYPLLVEKATVEKAGK